MQFMKLFRGMLLAIFAATAFTAPARAEQLVNPADVQAWADDYFGTAVAQKRVSGLTFAVVQDGKVIFAKGYGHADLGRGIPVDPETSGFQIGSVTKTFVATAIGQLVDSGKIKSLDDPINLYLKRIQLPGERGARVTVRQAMNHRAGFEDKVFGYFLASRRPMSTPLPAAEIERIAPKQVMEPGGYVNYNNWGIALLGYVVEDLTGQRLDHYLRDHVFLPLGMTHTTLYYDQAPANASQPYLFEKDGTPVAAPTVVPHPWISPGGGITSTAGDMAKYMNAHILRGENGGYPLLSPKMFRELHTETYRNSPVSIGFGNTFFTYELNGAPTVEHAGGVPQFQSMMTMIPDKRFGFFVSAMDGGLVPWAEYSDEEIAAGKDKIKNSLGGIDLREAIIERFLKRTRPVDMAAVRAAPKLDLSAFVGTYWTQKRSFTTTAALVGALDPSAVLTITLSDDGKGLLLNGVGPYTEVANGVFANKTGQPVWIDAYALDAFQPAHIAFDIDASGRVRGLNPDQGDQMWVPASPVFNPKTMGRVAAALGLLSLTGALLWVWPQPARLRRSANYLGLGAALCVLAIPAAMLVGFDKWDSLVNQAGHGQSGRFWVMTIAANLLLVTGIVLSVLSVREWRRAPAGGPGWARTGYRVHLSLVTLTVLGTAAALGFFNFLGVHVPQ